MIVQPFHPKPDTPHARRRRALGDAEVAGWVALARLVLGPAMNVQAPPNLAPDALELLLRSGAQRLGRRLAADGRLHQPRGAVADAAPSCARRTAAAGQRLVERLPVYPEHLLGRPEFFDPRVRDAALAARRRRRLGSPARRPAPHVEAA